MLALLYFPAEHKYAVYTPLFASAVIPLIVAAEISPGPDNCLKLVMRQVQQCINDIALCSIHFTARTNGNGSLATVETSPAARVNRVECQ